MLLIGSVRLLSNDRNCFPFFVNAFTSAPADTKSYQPLNQEHHLREREGEGRKGKERERKGGKGREGEGGRKGEREGDSDRDRDKSAM